MSVGDRYFPEADMGEDRPHHLTDGQGDQDLHVVLPPDVCLPPDTPQLENWPGVKCYRK